MRYAAIGAILMVTGLNAPAAAQDNAGDADKGATEFASACARCHRDVSKIAPNLSLEEPQTIYALTDFLASHHTTDAEMRADIVAFLLKRGT